MCDLKEEQWSLEEQLKEIQEVPTDPSLWRNNWCQ